MMINNKDYAIIEAALEAQWTKKDFDPSVLDSEAVRLFVANGLMEVDRELVTLTPAGECLLKAIKRMCKSEKRAINIEKSVESYRLYIVELRQKLKGSGTTWE